MKVLVAARKMTGAWTPGRKWGSEPTIVEVSPETLEQLEAAVKTGHIILYKFPEKAEKSALRNNV